MRAGACSRRDVARHCAAASRCGGCGPAVDTIIEAEQERGAGLDLFCAPAELAATG